jgi:hypothetical protein
MSGRTLLAVVVLAAGCHTVGDAPTLTVLEEQSVATGRALDEAADALPPQSTTIPGSEWVPVETGIPEYDELLAKYELFPIEGYGDYSGFDDAFGLDHAEIGQRLAQCVRDQGFGVTVDSYGSISLRSVPVDQNELAYATLIACRVGMHLPASGQRTDEQLEEIYAYQLALMDCYGAEGYRRQGDVITLDAYLELEGAWQALDIYDLPPGGAEWDRVNRVCPQSPVGGYGAWEPGDPVAPLP